MIGYCEMLERDNLDPGSQEKVAVISATGKRAARLTSQLLNLSRKQITCSRPENLNEIISEAKGMFSPLIGEDIEIEFRPDSNLDLVKVDRNQFDQILMNLIVNARDAMPSGGKISIETANCKLSEIEGALPLDLSEDSCVMLAVSDTGTGIDKETLKKIFEPLFTTKEVGKGTGLGLSVVYGIVRKCGGTIRVSSEVGKGTTFRIYFPRSRDTPVEQRERGREPLPPLGSETILLVENDSGVRKMSAEILRKSGNSILEAGDGIEALKLLGSYEGRVDLVVTDMAMAKMDGRELLENIRKTQPNIRSLFISGYATSEIAPGNDNENLAMLCKPFLPHELEAMVRKVLAE
jgi:CheY-like chemotaxis protein